MLVILVGISSKYFPLPEMLSFQFFTSVTFVACILSSSQMALNGLQKSEWIASFLFLLKTKSSGGLWLRNIRPVVFWRGVIKGFTFMVCFLPSIKYVICFRTILALLFLDCNSDCRHALLMRRGLCRGE